MNPRQTPLAEWLRIASPEERERLATLAGTSVNYLYQLAACRREPKVGLAFEIERATQEMQIETRGRLPAISASVLATMCAIDGLSS